MELFDASSAARKHRRLNVSELNNEQVEMEDKDANAEEGSSPEIAIFLMLSLLRNG